MKFFLIKTNAANPEITNEPNTSRKIECVLIKLQYHSHSVDNVLGMNIFWDLKYGMK